MLVVDDVEKPVRNNDAVPGAEAALDPHIAGIVEPLLHKHQRVGAAFPGLCHFLHHEGTVAVGAVLHLLGVVGQVLCRVLHPAAKGFFHLIGAQLMAVGPLLGVFAGPVRILLAEPCRRRAVDPPVACGGGKKGMLTHRFPPPAFRARPLPSEALQTWKGRYLTASSLRTL